MKNYKAFVVALTAMFTLTSLNAASGVFDFETLDGAAKDFIEGEGNGNTCTQNTPYWTDYGNFEAMTWNVSSSSGAKGHMNSSSYIGGVVANSKLNTGTDFYSDLNTVAGGGSNGSSNYGMFFLMPMLYSPSIEEGCVIGGVNFDVSVYRSTTERVDSQSFILDEGQEALQFTSIDVSLSAYTSNGLLNGDDFVDGSSPLSDVGTFFALRIYGLDETFQVIDDNYVDYFLAYNNGEEILLTTGWDTIDISSLSKDKALYGLTFEVMSNLGDSWGMTPAAMVAIDNIAYGTAAVPESAEWAAIFGAIALVFVVSRKRVKK